MKLSKVLGTDNMADVLTKYVDKKTMDAALVRMNLIRKTGRPACAPVAMGAWLIQRLMPLGELSEHPKFQ